MEIRYKVLSQGETNYLDHRMMGDSPINKTKLIRSSLSLFNSERVVSCSGVFGRQMYSLLFTTNYSKTHQINDFHKFYDQSFETRYDFELDEGVAFINAGFLSKTSLLTIRIFRRTDILQNLLAQPFCKLTYTNGWMVQQDVWLVAGPPAPDIEDHSE